MRRPMVQDAPCLSILSMAWAGNDRIAIECHINPSLSEYVETEIATGRQRRDLLGIYFTPAPDGSHVAHCGWIIHFAPPYAQSDYLQIDDLTIYPLPPGGPNTLPLEPRLEQIGRSKGLDEATVAESLAEKDAGGVVRTTGPHRHPARRGTPQPRSRGQFHDAISASAGDVTYVPIAAAW